MNASVTQLVLVGAGGYFLEIFDYLSNIEAARTKGANSEPLQIKGYLDKQPSQNSRGLSYMGPVGDYSVLPEDRFLICIGNPTIRERLFVSLKQRGASFHTLVHPTAQVSPSAKLGEGVIVCPFAIVNAEAAVAANVSLNVNTSVGHEAKVGQSSTLSPYAAVNGRAVLGSECFMGTRATIFPGVSVGDRSTIDSHSYVKQNVAEKMISSNMGRNTCVKNRFIQ